MEIAVILKSPTIKLSGQLISNSLPSGSFMPTA
jgi:hypothetical protein